MPTYPPPQGEEVLARLEPFCPVGGALISCSVGMRVLTAERFLGLLCEAVFCKGLKWHEIWLEILGLGVPLLVPGSKLGLVIIMCQGHRHQGSSNPTVKMEPFTISAALPCTSVSVPAEPWVYLQPSTPLPCHTLVTITSPDLPRPRQPSCPPPIGPYVNRLAGLLHSGIKTSELPGLGASLPPPV